METQKGLLETETACGERFWGSKKAYIRQRLHVLCGVHLVVVAVTTQI